MAHGKPDWNRTAGGLTTYQMDDLGELAARQGSIVTYDRRGDVIYLDDFEGSLLRWEFTPGGTGSAAALSTVAARSGIQSLLLTAGSDGNRNSEVQHLMPLPRVSTIGLEFSFFLPAAIESLEYQMFFSDSINAIIARVRVSDDDDELLFLNSGAGFTVFKTALPLNNGLGLFHTGKLIVDWQAREYIAFIFDDISYDLSGNALQTSGLPVGYRSFFRIVLTGGAGDNDTCHIDDVIITQNEP